MRIHKFKSTTAFIAIDLTPTEASSGPVRWARKVLQGGAKDLARSQTYTYAVLGMKMGGASAGISAEAPDRDEAIVAFASEAAEFVTDGTYLPDAAKGINEADLETLREFDPRDSARLAGASPSFADRCQALSVIVCADSTLGGLNDRTVAIEGSGDIASALVDLASTRGATVVIGPNDDGTAAEMAAVFASGADVIFVGSKMGVVTHAIAEKLGGAAAVVPWGRLPITAKALAILRRADVAVPADFVALAGLTIALWGDSERSETDIETAITELVGTMSTEFAASSDGPFMAACHQAEDFLRTWQDDLPFGRPLAP